MTSIDEKSDDTGAVRPELGERTQTSQPSDRSRTADAGSDLSRFSSTLLDPPRPMLPAAFAFQSQPETNFRAPRPMAPVDYGLTDATEDMGHDVVAQVFTEPSQISTSEYVQTPHVERSDIASVLELVAEPEPELEAHVATSAIPPDNNMALAESAVSNPTLKTSDVWTDTSLDGVRAQPQDRYWFSFAKRIAKIAAGVAVVWLAAIIVLIFAYRFIDPPLSSLMVQQRLTGQEITQDWVPLELISNNVVRAVMLSEDGRFCQHSGVDFEEMQNAIERAGDGTPRGASTISMQVIKNLFLWPSRSYVRKVVEIPMTWLMELVWPKARIMEVYLNIAEWGPGIFGVEAASQFHFNKSANRLNEREAARLAVALPNPTLRDAGDPGPKTRRLASDIQARMRAAYLGQTACVKVERRFQIERDNPADDGWRPVVRPSG